MDVLCFFFIFGAEDPASQCQYLRCEHEPHIPVRLRHIRFFTDIHKQFTVMHNTTAVS